MMIEGIKRRAVPFDFRWKRASRKLCPLCRPSLRRCQSSNHQFFL